LPTTRSCVCAAAPAVVPLRELPLLLERAFVERVDPFVRRVPLADAEPVDFARVRVVPAFEDLVLLLAEPALALADFAAVVRERLAVLLGLVPVDRFVVAMSPSQLCDPWILR
jgi:hypothetical protein